MTLREYNEDEIKELDARARYYDKDDDFSFSGELGRAFGSMAGISQIPNFIKRPLTYGFNHYISAPGAAAVRWLTSDKMEGNEKYQDMEEAVGGFYNDRDFKKALLGLPEDVKQARREHRQRFLKREKDKGDYSILLPRNKPSAITPRDGFILQTTIMPNSYSDPVLSILNQAESSHTPPSELKTAARFKRLSPGAQERLYQKADFIWNSRGSGRPGGVNAGYYLRDGKWFKQGTRPVGTRSKTRSGGRERSSHSIAVGSPRYNELTRIRSGKRAMRRSAFQQQKNGNQSRVVDGSRILTTNMKGAYDKARLKKVYMGTIQFNTNGTTSWVSGSGGDCGGNFLFWVRNTAFINSASEIGQSATRNLKYRIRRGLMAFIPATSAYATPDWRISIMIAREIDALWGLQGVPSNFVGAPATPLPSSTLTKTSILFSQHSCADAVWADRIECAIPPTGWLDTSCPISSTAIPASFGAATIPTLREATGFICCVNLSGTAPASVATNAVDVWMYLDIQFRDQCPVSNVLLDLAPPLEPLEMKQIRRVLQAIKADDDVDRLVAETDIDRKTPSPVPSVKLLPKKSSSLK